MEEKVNLARITDALYAILKDEVNGVTWEISPMGAKFQSGRRGYISCDEVEYSPLTKGGENARATFLLEVIDPNPPKTETEAIETLAMHIRKRLKTNETLDGWARSSRVRKIMFGSPAGHPNIGAALFEYEVNFEEEF